MPAYRASVAFGSSDGSNPAGAISPASGDLFVVFCHAAGNTNTAPTCSDNNGGTYQLIDTIAHTGNNSAVWAATASGGDTTGTGDRTCSVTPAIGDLLVVFVSVTTNTNASATMTDDQGGTYYNITSALYGASTAIVTAFVRTALCTTTTAHVITAATGSNEAGSIAAHRIVGMYKTGSAAIRSFGKTDNGASAAAPSATLSNTPLTTNLCLFAVGSADTTTSPPTSFTERSEVGQATPTTRLEVATRDNGQTVAAITSAATASTDWGCIVLELDTERDCMGSVFVRNEPLWNTTSTTVTASLGTQMAAEVVVVAVSGMGHVGSAAVRSSGKQASQASGGTPTPVLNQNALTGNLTMTAVFSNDTTTSPNASWTEAQDASQTLPTTAMEVAYRNSGFTSASIACAATQASPFGSFALELNSPVPLTWAGSAPTLAAAMASAVGYGTWSAGWAFQEASGNPAAQFGSPTLTASGALTYEVTGPLPGDKAIQFTSQSTVDGTGSKLAGGDVYDIGTGDDITVFLLLRPDTTAGYVWHKRTAATAYLVLEFTGTTPVWSVRDNGGTSASINGPTFTDATWQVWAVTLEQATNKIRIGILKADGTFPVLSVDTSFAGGAMDANAMGFGLNAVFGAGSADFTLAHAWLAHGATAGVPSANLGDALMNLGTVLNTEVASGGGNVLKSSIFSSRILRVR